MKAKNSINAIYAGLAMILRVFIAGRDFRRRHDAQEQSFQGDTGMVIHSQEGNKMVLTLSDDFKAPDARIRIGR